MALNKNGTIRSLNIVEPSGNRAVDEQALFLMRDASESFPPVPDYLPHDPFSMDYTITFYNYATHPGYSLSLH
jgi:TonB family protein